MSDERSGWNAEGLAWLAERPVAVQEAARKWPPWQLYRLTTTGQLATLTSYSEAPEGICETCCITAWQEWAPEITAVGVFGVRLNDLQPIAPQGLV